LETLQTATGKFLGSSQWLWIDRRVNRIKQVPYRVASLFDADAFAASDPACLALSS
jgi:hypothetical protein